MSQTSLFERPTKTRETEAEPEENQKTEEEEIGGEGEADVQKETDRRPSQAGRKENTDSTTSAERPSTKDSPKEVASSRTSSEKDGSAVESVPEPERKGQEKESKGDRTRTDEIREKLHPEQIVEVSGTPVRLILTSRGSVGATMVESGYFPISMTGFRSLVPGAWSARRRLNGQTPRASQMLEMGRHAMEGLPEEKEKKANSTIRRSGKQSDIDPEERPISAIVRATSPSIRKIADVALTGGPEIRDEAIEAGIKQYERAVRLGDPNYEPIRKHRNWTVESYEEKVQRAEAGLETLNAAQAGGLFTGSQNLTPLVEEASPSVVRAYARDGYIEWEKVSPTPPRHESGIRSQLRHDLGVDALTEETLGQLAKRMAEVETRTKQKF
jgi:hypothetical protein